METTTQTVPLNIAEDEDDIVIIEGIHQYIYEQLVKPSQYFLIPKYFIDYWLHKLGPKTAWIYISLQQAWWREQNRQNSDPTAKNKKVYCQLSQKAIAKELGMERHAISRGINQNPWRHWIIPKVEKQWGWKIGTDKYHRPATKYTLNLSMPLVPEHLKGLYVYFKGEGNTAQAIEAGINNLLSYNSRNILEILEKLGEQADIEFEQPHTIGEVIEKSTGFKLSEVSLKKAKKLDMLYYKLHHHLTELGGVMCRQYFRTQWVPILKPSSAWLIMILRSRCYYNPKTKEMRDSYTWKKKDIANTLGQSTQNLKLLLNKANIKEFITIIEDEETDNQGWSITLKVLMDREPLTPESQRAYQDLLAENQGRLITAAKTEEKQTEEKQAEPLTQRNKSLAEQEWQAVLAQLQLQMTRATFNTWLKNTHGVLHKGPVFVVEVKNEYAKEWLENRLKKTIERTAKNTLSQTIEISFVIQNLVDE